MHNVTKYDGMLATIHCEELTETATRTANTRNLSYSALKNHLFLDDTVHQNLLMERTASFFL